MTPLRRSLAVLASALLLAGCARAATPTNDAEPSTSMSVVAAPTRTPNTAIPRLGQFPPVPTVSFADGTVTKFQAVLDAAVEGVFPGVTATVMAADRGAWSGAAGTADGVRPVEPNAQFGIASITKTVIAAEVLRLAESGLLALSDPVSEHLPGHLDFDTNGATVEHLLAMESGLPNAELEESEVEGDPLRDWDAAEILDMLPTSRLPPGTGWEYSNTSYILLGLVIEHTTGTDVAQALRANLLADRALSSLVYQPEERPQGPLALPHRGRTVRPNIIEVGGGYVSTKAFVSAAGGAGAMASDSPALALWAYRAFGGQLLSEASLLAMTDFGTGADYDGYGLGIFDLGDGVVGHAGLDSGGYAAILMVVPAEGIVVTVMTNTALSSMTPLQTVGGDLLAALGP